MGSHDEKTEKSAGKLAFSLLCPETLKSAMPASSASVEAREGLKALLSAPSRPTASAPPEGPEERAWERSLGLIVEDFLLRRGELLKLNKARKSQIEASIRRHASNSGTLEELLHARIGSPEMEGLSLFAHEIATFQLLQILLVKRWTDLKLLEKGSPASPSAQTLNWTISSFLKKNGRRPLQRHDWSFLKQNCYSWFEPNQKTIERIRLMLSPFDLATADGNFLLQVLHHVSDSNRLAMMGMAPTLVETSHAWELLLEQLRCDQSVESYQDLNLSREENPILVSGLAAGSSLCSIREILGKDLQGVWAFTNSDFQRFLTEIHLLWMSTSDIPQLHLHPKSLLEDKGRNSQGGTLFSESVRLPYLASIAACFPEENGEELEDAVRFFDQLKDNGYLLLMTNTFWPTDVSEAAQQLREATLKKACLMHVVDLRHLAGAHRERLPKGIFLFRKSASKELRDANRPLIQKLKGCVETSHLQQVWRGLLARLDQNQHPGEVIQFPLSIDSVRLESMAAATSQQHLRSTPWQTLTEPSFYETSGRLKRHPQKAFASGTLLRSKTAKNTNFQRAIYLKDLPGVALKAEQQEGQFLFLPDQGVPEHPQFFVAQVNSAPIQFWYRLECEQSLRLSRGQQKQSEQLLKMMPLVRLFPNGALIPAISSGIAFGSLPELDQRLRFLFRQTGRNELQVHAELHQIIVDLEHSIEQNLGVTREFSQHLYPDLEFERWSLPTKLPEVSAIQCLKLLQHLDHLPLLHHPSIHATRLKPGNDFRITDALLRESPLGPVAELELVSHFDSVLKLTGPSILLKAAHAELQKKSGRSWQETALKILLPTDAGLVNAQLTEILRTIEDQLKNTHACIDLMDKIFCRLLSLTESFEDGETLQMIRRHLSREETKISVNFQRTTAVKPEGFAAPIGILQ